MANLWHMMLGWIPGISDGYNANKSIFLRSVIRFELQLNKLLDWFWALVNSVIAQVYVEYIILISPSCFANS